MIGEIMLATGLSMFVAKDIAYPIYKSIKNRKIDKLKHNSEVPNDLLERTQIYTKLFDNMGIMKPDKGDWVKVVNFLDEQCYTMTKFIISDSLSLSTFIKKLDDIKPKLDVSHLEIFNTGKYMCFRCRKDNLPLEPYVYKKIKQSLVQLGLDLDNKPVYWDLTVDPHCGIFAESGAGKSRQVHGMICFILNNDHAAKHYMIDLKNGMEFGRYKNLPNVVKFAKDMDSAKEVIAAIEDESIRRYEIMEKEGYTDYNEYLKDKPRTKMRRIYLWIDEIADIMDDKKANTKGSKVEGYDIVGTLIRLGRKVRAVGIHIIPSTQRPTVDFIPASLKSNLGCIIGMKVLNERNSQLIIDDKGLEELDRSQCIGKVSSKMVFFRSFYIDNKMINEIIKQNTPNDKIKVEVSDNIQDGHRCNKNNVIDVEYEVIDPIK